MKENEGWKLRASNDRDVEFGRVLRNLVHFDAGDKVVTKSTEKL